jgi:hypothetical protein
MQLVPRQRGTTSASGFTGTGSSASRRSSTTGIKRTLSERDSECGRTSSLRVRLLQATILIQWRQVVCLCYVIQDFAHLRVLYSDADCAAPAR